MRIITRYVLLEFIKVFLVALTVLTLMMILVGLVREAQQQGLEPQHVLAFIPYILPEALRFTVPGTVLFAASTVFGRLSGSNEVVALKSLGISPMTIVWPVLAMAFFLSLTTVWLNELAVTWGRQGIRSAIMWSAEDIIYSMLRTHRTYSTGQFSIIVKAVDDRTLLQPTISFLGIGSNPSITLTAERAELRSDLSTSSLSIVCHNGTLEVEGQGRLRFHDTIERVVPLNQASTAGGYYSISDMPLSRIAGELEKKQQAVHDDAQQEAAKAAFQMITGDVDGLTSSEWNVLANFAEVAREDISRMQTEPHRRWSNGFTCLCFALVGAATAIRMRNADLLTSFGVCFLPILIIYYPLLALGVDQAKQGTFPPAAVWLGNVVLLLAGLWQMRKVVRY